MIKNQQPDSSLVEIIEPSNVKLWVISFTLVCAIVFVAYFVICGSYKDKSRPPFTATDGQRQKLAKYQSGIDSQIVMVGSSLSKHFRSEYFNDLDIYNLSLAGGSALTGLEIIANSRFKPKIILIEANLIYRDSDKILVADFATSNKYFGDALFLLKDFQPVKTILGILLDKGQDPDVMLKNPKKIEDEAQNYRLRAETLLSQTSEKSADGSLQMARVLENEKINFEQPTNDNLDRILEIADALSIQGVQVIFYELPFPDLVMGSKFSQGVSIILQNRLNSPNTPPLITFAIDETQLCWGDAFHLDERSSIIVGRDLERQINLFLEK